MQWLLGVYTNRFNHQQKEFGHLFSGRYKALPVDGSGNGYLKAVCDYVHLNPVRAGLITPEEPLQTMEQLSAVPPGAGAATSLVAGRPPFGRVGYPQG